MSLGEKARIIMTPGAQSYSSNSVHMHAVGVAWINRGGGADFAYGPRGIPGLIPPDAHLYLEVSLMAIH